MATPAPPILPDSREQFLEHVSTQPDAWFRYCQAAYEWISSAASTSTDTLEKLEHLTFELSSAREEIHTLSEKVTRQEGVINYQKELVAQSTEDIIRLKGERNAALAAATPAVLLRERLRLLLPHLPSLLAFRNDFLTPTSFQEIRMTSAASLHRSSRN